MRKKLKRMNKYKLKSLISYLLCAIAFSFFSVSVQAKPGDQIRYLPVQDSGRIKPFDTFAAETLEIIYGKKYYKFDSASEAVPAHWVVLTWMLAPESWVSRPLFEVKHFDVLKNLGLSKEKKYFTGDELFKSEKFANSMQELANKRESKEKLTPYFQALQRLENQFFIFREMASGRLLHVLPKKDSDDWFSVAELPAEIQPSFIELSKNVAQYLGAIADKSNSTAYGDNLDKSVLTFQEQATK